MTRLNRRAVSTFVGIYTRPAIYLQVWEISHNLLKDTEHPRMDQRRSVGGGSRSLSPGSLPSTSKLPLSSRAFHQKDRMDLMIGQVILGLPIKRCGERRDRSAERVV